MRVRRGSKSRCNILQEPCEAPRLEQRLQVQRVRTDYTPASRRRLADAPRPRPANPVIGEPLDFLGPVDIA